MNLLTIDPSKATAGARLDAFIHEHWMGRGPTACASSPTYSTNADSAGQARRRADDWRMRVNYGPGQQELGIELTIWWTGGYAAGFCAFSEVTGSTENETKELAEALAICRAILALIQAKRKD